MAGTRQENAGSRGSGRRIIDDIARAQGITTPQDAAAIFGAAADLWDSEQEFESFIAGIEQRRRNERKADANDPREEEGA